MLASSDKPEAPVIQSRDELVAHIEKGAKPKADWRIGTEHERFPSIAMACAPSPTKGLRAYRLCSTAWRIASVGVQVYDRDAVIALEDPSGHGASITLEPGGQFELSGAPVRTIFQTCEEVGGHLKQVSEIADPLGISFLALGFSPLWTLAETPRMPNIELRLLPAPRDFFFGRTGNCSGRFLSCCAIP